MSRRRKGGAHGPLRSSSAPAGQAPRSPHPHAVVEARRPWFSGAGSWGTHLLHQVQPGPAAESVPGDWRPVPVRAWQYRHSVATPRGKTKESMLRAQGPPSRRILEPPRPVSS